MKLIKRGWHTDGNVHVVQTERMGGDKCLDWVAVQEKSLAEKIWHGGEVPAHTALWVGNRLKDFSR